MDLIERLHFPLAWRHDDPLSARLEMVRMRPPPSDALTVRNRSAALAIQRKFKGIARFEELSDGRIRVEKLTDVAPEQWTSVVHPERPWAVIVHLDHDGFDAESATYWDVEEENKYQCDAAAAPESVAVPPAAGGFRYRKVERFPATATLRDFVERIAEGPGHNCLLDGLDFVLTKDGVDWYLMHVVFVDTV